MSKQQGFGSILDEIIREKMKEFIKNMMRDDITQEQVEALENNKTAIEVIKGFSFYGITLTDFSGMKFEDCFFKDCCFKEGHFIKTEFNCCCFKNCDFESADFGETNFKDCHLGDSNLKFADFRKANLYRVNLHECGLSWAKFICAYLERVYFYGGSLQYTFFSGVGKNIGFVNTDLRGTNFSGSNGITMSPIEYLEDNFKKTTKGYIVYKAIGQCYQPNPDWVIKPGKILKEAVNPDRTIECGCGVNVATYEWVKDACDAIDFDIWECLIKWEWLPGVVVPYDTDGKIRSERVQLLRIIEEG